MTEEEAEEGYVLACQMRPKSDCVIRIAASSRCLQDEGVSAYKGEISAVDHLSDDHDRFSLKLEPSRRSPSCRDSM